jgi:DNA-binding IclR family transcriptional regulator
MSYGLQHCCALCNSWRQRTVGKVAKGRGSTVQSVERAIRILESFSLERPERGVNELGRELGLHKSTVSRLMVTLEQGGLLTRNPDTERYRLGVDLIGLAAQVTSHMDVRWVARPLLRELSESCQETVNLVVLDAGQVVNLEQFVPPARRIKSIGWVGRRMPPHCTAAGKVLLAHLSQDGLASMLPPELDCFTPHTVTDLDELRQELVRVRQQGYATAEEELEAGLNAVAVPILNHTGQVQAAASVSGPAYRVTPGLFPVLAEQLIGTAAEISRRLGYQHAQ